MSNSFTCLTIFHYKCNFFVQNAVTNLRYWHYLWFSEALPFNSFTVGFMTCRCCSNSLMYFTGEKHRNSYVGIVLLKRCDACMEIPWALTSRYLAEQTNNYFLKDNCSVCSWSELCAEIRWMAWPDPPQSRPTSRDPVGQDAEQRPVGELHS